MDKKKVAHLVYILLCKRVRRGQILAHLHVKQPCEAPHGGGFVSVAKLFINIVLYHKFALVLKHDSISFFNGKLPLMLSWLTPEERSIVNQMYDERVALFKNRKEFQSSLNHFEYSHFALNGARYDHFSLIHRRELVRDFLGLCMSYEGKATLEPFYMWWKLIEVLQHLIAERGIKTDPALLQFHDQLQKQRPIKDVPIHYP